MAKVNEPRSTTSSPTFVRVASICREQMNGPTALVPPRRGPTCRVY